MKKCVRCGKDLLSLAPFAAGEFPCPDCKVSEEPQKAIVAYCEYYNWTKEVDINKDQFKRFRRIYEYLNRITQKEIDKLEQEIESLLFELGNHK